MRLASIIAISLYCVSLSAIADSYKCKLPNGSTEIRDSPCAGGSSSVAAIRTYENTAEEAARVNAARRENQRQLDWANERYNEEQAVRDKRLKQDRMEALQAANQRAAAERQAEAQRQQQLLDDVKQIRANQENSKNQKMTCFQNGPYMDCKTK